jgi:hypothetical protein
MKRTMKVLSRDLAWRKEHQGRGKFGTGLHIFKDCPIEKESNAFCVPS